MAAQKALGGPLTSISAFALAEAQAGDRSARWLR
jgi:hypothetical protein